MILTKNVLLINERVEKVFLFSTTSKAKFILPSFMCERGRGGDDSGKFGSNMEKESRSTKEDLNFKLNK